MTKNKRGSQPLLLMTICCATLAMCSCSSPGTLPTSTSHAAPNKEPPASGRLIISVLVGKDGRVIDTRIDQPSGFAKMDASVQREARKRWWLIPGTENCQPIEMWHTLSVAFQLTPESDDAASNGKLPHPASDNRQVDVRGRTMWQDQLDYLEPATSGSRSANELSSWDHSTLTAEQEKVALAIAHYWTVATDLVNARSSWPVFLSRNHLPTETPHSPTVTALEGELQTTVTSGPPNASWGEQACRLASAYREERRKMALAIDKSVPLTGYRPRKSPCGVPAPLTSGKPGPTMADQGRKPDNPGGEQGLVILSLHIADTGCAREAAIAVSSGSDALDESALRWYETATFLPGEVDGKAVATTHLLEVDF